MPDQKLTVIGCGLIGGSLCLGFKRRRPGWSVVAVDVPERLPSIADACVADKVASVENAAEHISESALVIIATPVEAILKQLETIAPHLKRGTVVTDVGSTKTLIMEKARSLMPPGVHFVGGHPIAGSERQGVQAADPLIFNERVYAICPYPDTPADALLAIIDMAQDLLALPVAIEPEEHDRIMAMVSHVPQLLAVALMHAALEEDSTHGLLNVIAGRGFLDLTRIAASDFSLWKGIIDTNKPAIWTALERLEKSIALLKEEIDRNTTESAAWKKASDRRRNMGTESLSRMRKSDLRNMIDRYDEQIMKALSGRIQAAIRIGKLKSDMDADVHDPDRERRLMNQRLEWSRSLDMPSELVTELFNIIMKHSKEIQKKKPRS